jgi:hypothetical protein
VSRVLLAALSGSTLLTSLVLTPATAHAADFPFTLVHTSIPGVSKCIGPNNGNTSNGTPVVLMDCNQLWHGNGRDRSVRSFGDKCFSLAANHPVPTPVGTPLVLRDCTSPVSGDQQWTFVALNFGGAGNIWVLRNPPSLECAGLANGSGATGTPLVMQTCTFLSANQLWLTPDRPDAHGFDEDDGLF